MELNTNKDVFAGLKLKENIEDIENEGTIKKDKLDIDIANILICSNGKSKNEESSADTDNNSCYVNNKKD